MPEHKWEELVLQELQRQSSSLENLQKEFNEFRLEVVAVQAERHGKSTVYGAIGGFLAGAGASLLPKIFAALRLI